MKRFLIFAASAAVLLIAAASCDKYDDTELQNRVDNIDGRVSALETMCTQFNSDIASLRSIVQALQNNDYVTSVTPVTVDGRSGYKIDFSKSGSVTIMNGKDGADGKNGVDGKNGSDGKDGKDGVDGKDGKDGKNGVDGKNGSDGKDGKDGADGKDGVTPQLKIEDGYWYISYDSGSTWTQLGKAVGENGKDGADGKDGGDGKTGESLFSSVINNGDNVEFILADGSSIKVPIYQDLALSFDSESPLELAAGQSVSVDFTLSGTLGTPTFDTICEGNLTAELGQSGTTGGSLRLTAGTGFTQGKVMLFASDKGRTVFSTLKVKGGINYLKFTTAGTSTIRLRQKELGNFEYSYDGKEWVKWQGNHRQSFDGYKITTYDDYIYGPIVIDSSHPAIYLRGVNSNLQTPKVYEGAVVSGTDSVGIGFSMYGDSVSCSGNVMTLLDYTDLGKAVPDSCFWGLFYNCKLMTKAPELPATSLGKCCYALMFLRCSNLTKAPDLPAEDLPYGCYGRMFEDCEKLNYVRCLAVSMQGDKYTLGQYGSATLINWLYNVSPTGTFVKAPEANWKQEGQGEENGRTAGRIPSGWTIVDDQ